MRKMRPFKSVTGFWWGPALLTGALLPSLAACTTQQQTAVETPSSSPAKEEQKPAAKKTPLDKARAAIRDGKFRDADSLLERAIKDGENGATTLRAELLFMTGRYAVLHSLKIKEAATQILQARAHQKKGELDEALALLTSISGQAEETARATLWRGAILLELGKRQEAERILSTIVEAAAEDGKPSAELLSLAGRAAHLVREPELANDLFDKAEQAGGTDLELLLWRAELYLEKHDAAHAEEVLVEAEKLAPHHPELQITYARLWLERALAFDQAEELAREVLKTNPQHTTAHFVLAGIDLRDMNFAAAEAHLKAGLKINPRDLPLLSLVAAAHFLKEDPDGFEKAIDRVHEFSPKNAEVFRIVGEFAEWEHRYPEVEKLMRRASRLDRKDGRIRALLGLTLVRAGSDAAGIVELNQAYKLDPYNVRVINTLKLYEDKIPELYVDHSDGPFRFRFPKDEAELLKRYVPALLEDAHSKMVVRYGYTPRAPIGIEIYSSRDEFAVRTSGLPRTAIAGVCFGRKVATMSPVGSPGNLGMTLWHELAHVFHLGLSKNRTPRWLTEGMAEWETAVRKVGWSRELDLQLVGALRADRLPSLDLMSRAFTRARRMDDVATAYYASGLLAEWIVESRGEDDAVALFREMGKKRLPPLVIPEVLGAPSAELDTEFRGWLDERLKRFDEQFVVADERTPADELEVLLKSSPDDRDLNLRFGHALLAAGELKKAEELLTRLNKKTFDAQATFALSRIALATERKKAATKHLETILEKRVDGYEIRMVLARTYFALKDEDAAQKHLEAAVALDDHAEEAWSLLASLHHKNKDAEKELAAVRRWASLSEHDPTVHQRLLEMLIEAEKYDEAARTAELAIWTDLAGREMHRLAGLAYSRAGDLKRAEFEWRSALLTPPMATRGKTLLETWVGELNRRGLQKRANEVIKELAREVKPGEGSK